MCVSSARNQTINTSRNDSYFRNISYECGCKIGRKNTWTINLEYRTHFPAHSIHLRVLVIRKTTKKQTSFVLGHLPNDNKTKQAKRIILTNHTLHTHCFPSPSPHRHSPPALGALASAAPLSAFAFAFAGMNRTSSRHTPWKKCLENALGLLH